MPASTVSRLIKGRTTDPTVKAVAAALRIPERRLLAQLDEQTLGPWEPPLEAHLLTTQEREALGVIIRGLVQDRGGSSEGRQPKAQKTNDSPDGPDDQADLATALAGLRGDEDEFDEPPAPKSLADHRRERLLRDAQEAETAADDGGDSDEE